MSFKSMLCAFFDKEFWAELLSTFMLILVGDGSVAQFMLLNSGKNKSEPFLLVNFGYGAAVTFGVYIAGSVSGAHMNPAVSIALALVKKFQWRKVPKYIAGQMLGAFIGAVVVFLVYLDRLREDSDLLEEDRYRGIFATYPAANTTIEGQFLDQVVGTMILLLMISALTDKNNALAQAPEITPLAVGLTVFGIGASFGTNCGYAINPARDLSPRIASAIFGYDNTFGAGNTYFWIPVLGPVIGGMLGAVLYYFVIERHRDCADSEGDATCRGTEGDATVQQNSDVLRAADVKLSLEAKDHTSN